MLRQSIDPKRCLRLLGIWATPETWLLAASIIWCAVLGCGLAYVILITAL
jgi:hypothetical protein